MSELQKVGPGKKISLHFSVSLIDGQLLDNTRERPEPAEFVFGDGSLIPGFESAIAGLKAGDRRSVIIQAEKAFGAPNPDNIQRFMKVEFAGMDLQPGLVVSFADKNKAELPGVVTAVDEETVEVDFNHPLAGRDLIFEVDIIRVMDADAAAVSLSMPGGKA